MSNLASLKRESK